MGVEKLLICLHGSHDDGLEWVADSEGNGVGLPELIFHGDACWKAGKTHATAYMRFKGTHAGRQSFMFKCVP